MCSNILVLRILYLFKTTLNIVRFAIPLGLILIISLDLYKNLIINKENNEYIIVKKISKKIFAAILIFCIPTSINLVFDLLNKINIGVSNETSFLSCYQEVNLDLIKRLESEQELKLTEQEEEERKKALVTIQENDAKIKALQEENAKQSQSSNTSNKSYTDATTDMNKQNKVYRGWRQNPLFHILVIV